MLFAVSNPVYGETSRCDTGLLDTNCSKPQGLVEHGTVWWSIEQFVLGGVGRYCGEPLWGKQSLYVREAPVSESHSQDVPTEFCETHNSWVHIPPQLGEGQQVCSLTTQSAVLAVLGSS